MIVSRVKAEEAILVLLAKYDGRWDMGEFKLDTLTPEKLKLLYREAAKATHPDAGGKAEDFARVDWAKCALEAWLAKAEPAPIAHTRENCPNCHGKGYFMMRKGFSGGLRKQCHRCRGTGDANLDIDTANEG